MAAVEIITKIDATTHLNSVYFSINFPPDEIIMIMQLLLYIKVSAKFKLCRVLSLNQFLHRMERDFNVTNQIYQETYIKCKTFGGYTAITLPPFLVHVSNACPVV